MSTVHGCLGLTGGECFGDFSGVCGKLVLSILSGEDGEKGRGMMVARGSGDRGGNVNGSLVGSVDNLKSDSGSALLNLPKLSLQFLVLCCVDSMSLNCEASISSSVRQASLTIWVLTLIPAVLQKM